MGSIPQASRSSCTGSRSDSGNRFAFFSRTRRRQWRRVFLAFSASAWQQVTTPMAAALFLIGMAFFFASHLYLGWKRLQRK